MVSQNLVKTHFKVLLLVCRERPGGVSSASGQVKSLVKRFDPSETSGRRKLCIVLCHSCHIYGIC